MAKKNIEAHTSKSKKAMGDYYGTGVKQTPGRSREDSMANPVSRANLKKPPKKLA